MKRYGIFGILVLIVTLMTALMAGAAVIKGSKHDLSYRTTGTVLYMSADLASGGTSEICVFCHTPHGGNTAAPLWNRANVGAVVTPYSSDVMSALSYTVGDSTLGTGALHAKTRICLSCHDGTIAMGNLANLPQGLTADIPILNTVGGLMPQAAAGYIGTNLSDDHPVAIRYVGLTPDPELRSTPSTISPGGPIRLYTSAGTDYIECTSCHNPHDNQYGNFLVGSNTQSGICIACHNKTGFATSIHGTPNTLFPYAPPTGGTPATLGANVGEVKCMNCHFPHKAGITDVAQLPRANPNAAAKAGYYLLSFQEEMSCYNTTNRWNQATTACHGTGGLGKNIQSEVAAAKWTKHEVGKYSQKHEAYEARAAGTDGWAGPLPGKWHVECADCHNPHTAGPTNHTRGLVDGNKVLVSPLSPLYGTGGVTKPGTPPAWPPVPYDELNVPKGSGYTYIEPIGVVTTASPGVAYEYEICYKCHTDFAWASKSPDSPSLGAGRKMTNQALEFKAVNASYHPIEAATGRNAGVTLVAPWNTNKGTQTMYCADCHTKENDGSPSGTHGSTKNAILRSDYTNTYDTDVTAKQPNGELCHQCHNDSIYNTANGEATAGTDFKTAGENLHNKHATMAARVPPSTYAYRCVNCHTRVPHGYKTTGMVVLQGDGFPYEAGATNAGKIATYTPPPGDWGVLENDNCTTVNGCHQ